MRATIIGIKGVGMAHAIACRSLGIEVVAVLDTDPHAVNRLGDVWINQWGPYTEKILSDQPRPYFTTDPGQLDSIKSDILVVATPTEFHIPYLLRYGMNHMLCLVEKPLSYSSDEVKAVPSEIRHKTYVGHKWMCHPKYTDAINLAPIALFQGHQYPPQETHKKVCGVIWDLGVHAFAHLLGYLPSCQWAGIQIVWHHVTPTIATVGLVIPGEDRSMYRTRDQEAVIHVGYHEIGRGEVMISGTMLHWSDLFAEQLRRLLKGDHPAPFGLGAWACELVGRIQPNG